MQRHARLIARQAAPCTDLYQHPAPDESIDAFSPFTVTWDTNCVLDAASTLDIYLYDVAGTGQGPVFTYKNIQANSGTFQTAFSPQWWNATTAGVTYLKMQFANSDEPSWAASYALGPQFAVSWNGTVPAGAAGDDGTHSTGDAVQVVSDPGREKALQSGKLVAAILIPLLVAMSVIGGYVFWQRKKQSKASKRWSQAVDRRMSQISQTWSAGAGRSVSVVGSQRSNAHARNGSNYSFVSPNASFGGAARPTNENRQSTISFATQHSPSKSRSGLPQRPMSTASYPRVGVNSRDALQPLSPEQDSPEVFGGSTLKAPYKRSHVLQNSIASSLRNEVSMFDEEHLAAAVSVINGDRDLSRSLGSTPEPDRPVSALSYETAPSSQASLAQHGHSKQESLASLKMPRLERASGMSPDNALAAYATGPQHLKTHTSARSLPVNRFGKRISTLNPGLPTSASDPDLPVSFGQAQ